MALAVFEAVAWIHHFGADLEDISRYSVHHFI